MRVLLDACVLYPTVLREILIGCAAEGLYEPRWSPRILEEWARAAAKLGREGEEIARAEVARLRADWPRAEVQPRAGDLSRLTLPDPNDVHVLAAAIAASADGLLTLNARDFPRHTLSEEGLSRLDPDGFLRALHLEAPGPVEAVVNRVHTTAQTLAGEPLDQRALLKRARLPKTARAIERAAS